MTVARRLALCGAALLTAACSSTATPAPRVVMPVVTPSPLSETIYAHTGASDPVPPARQLVYVPNSDSDSVDVIDPATLRVIDHFGVGKNPQHITPSWDMRTLYVDNDREWSLTEIDPATGKPGRSVVVPDPYNLYFTPDGAHAIVVSEARRRLDIRDPKTWELQATIAIPFKGPNHLDFSPDGKYALVSCEFSGRLVKVDLEALRVSADVHLGGKPVDVRISPDGTVFFVANETRNGVSVVDPVAMREIAFVPTGRGTHGFVVSRDARSLYVTNRLAGTISVLDFGSRHVVATWDIGGSPDMGGVTADGSRLWVSGRYDAAVYVVDTATGHLVAKIPVGRGPHGVCVFPQPGRFSLGHTGNYR